MSNKRHFLILEEEENSEDSFWGLIDTNIALLFYYNIQINDKIR